jgi:uncharacterized membrane protein
LNKNQKTNEQTKQLVVDIVNNQKPQTTQQLIVLMTEKYSIPPEKVTLILSELEIDGLFNFTEQKPSTLNKKRHLFFQKHQWYWFTVVFSIATTLAVFLIPASDHPIIWLRYLLGFIFALFFPGYSLSKLIFPNEIPKIFTTQNNTPKSINSWKIDLVNRIPFSIGLSFALLVAIGLILNFTPWGITLIPVMLSLLMLTLILATGAELQCH